MIENVDIKCAEEVEIALKKAKEHAKAHGKPVLLSRVALFLGKTSDEIPRMIRRYSGENLSEEEKAIGRALQLVKQECRADLEDCLADKGNTSGFIFLGKVNHDMVERTQQDINFKPVVFTGEDDIED